MSFRDRIAAARGRHHNGSHVTTDDQKGLADMDMNESITEQPETLDLRDARQLEPESEETDVVPETPQTPPSEEIEAGGSSPIAGNPDPAQVALDRLLEAESKQLEAQRRADEAGARAERFEQDLAEAQDAASATEAAEILAEPGSQGPEHLAAAQATARVTEISRQLARARREHAVLGDAAETMLETVDRLRADGFQAAQAALCEVADIDLEAALREALAPLVRDLQAAHASIKAAAMTKPRVTTGLDQIGHRGRARLKRIEDVLRLAGVDSTGAPEETLQLVEIATYTSPDPDVCQALMPADSLLAEGFHRHRERSARRAERERLRLDVVRSRELNRYGRISDTALARAERVAREAGIEV